MLEEKLVVSSVSVFSSTSREGSDSLSVALDDDDDDDDEEDEEDDKSKVAVDISKSSPLSVESPPLLTLTTVPTSSGQEGTIL